MILPPKLADQITTCDSGVSLFNQFVDPDDEHRRIGRQCDDKLFGQHGWCHQFGGGLKAAQNENGQRVGQWLALTKLAVTKLALISDNQQIGEIECICERLLNQKS